MNSLPQSKNGQSATITKVLTFEAAHFLPHHTGQCSRLHGHTYRLEISIWGYIQTEPGSSQGMVVDFGDLKQLCQRTFLDDLAPFIRESLPPDSQYHQGGLDHNLLNWIIPGTTTAERVAHWIWDVLIRAGLPNTSLRRIRLWETQTNYVEITPEDRAQTTEGEIEE